MKRIVVMSSIPVLATILATLALVFAPMVALAQYKESFNANLTGSSEVPPVETSADGSAIFHVAEDEAYVDFSLTVDSSEPITSAHLHCATAGVNGPVAAPLYLQIGTTTATSAPFVVTGQLTAADVTDSCVGIETLPHLIQAMRENRLYVNTHAATNPDGLIRGQLMAGAMPPSGGGDNGNGTSTPPMEIEEEISEILEQIRILRERLVELLSILWSS